jgi:hypothetical protein
VTADPQPPWSGPWADDARRIFAILQSHDGHHEPPAAEAGEEEPASSPIGMNCPLCQAMTMVRRSGPDLLDRIADLAGGLAATLRATDPEPPAEPAGPSTRPPVTVPIDVSD